MKQALAGKHAVVTGAARGLGRGIAVHLARLGSDVLLADLDFSRANEFGKASPHSSTREEIQALGGRAVEFEGDLSVARQAQAMVYACRETFGSVDILVNSAGGMIVPMERSCPTEVPEEDVRKLLDVNYMTMFHCCQAAGRAMKEQHAGAIVNISSCAARFTMPGGISATYGAVKAAVTHFTRSLALELAPHGIRVNGIAPSVLLTPRIVAQAKERGIGRPEDAREVPLGRYGTPQDVANVVEFLVTDLSQFVIGQSISVCGGKHLTPS